MQTIILIIHVLVGAGVIGLVLLQHGKGADMGAAFGSGSAGSLFGSSGSANFLSRSTAVLTAVFFVTSLGLTYLSTSKPSSQGVVVGKPVSAPDAPAGDKPAVPPAVVPDADSKTKDIPK
jgi:preprotein translocase subunit SecG